MLRARWAVACLLPALISGQAVTVKAADNAVETPLESRPAPQAGPDYRIGPEDLLRVSVWENKELTLDLVVRPDGKISMPLAQEFIAQGLTALELGTRIREKLLSYVKEPQVSVIVLQVNAPKYFVMGYVAKPGTYPLRSETSVLQALAVAGGFTQFASPKSIKLIRVIGGKQDIRNINYNDMIQEGGMGNYILMSGDTIVVP